MNFRKKIFFFFVFSVVAGLLTYLFVVNPSSSDYLIHCPFKYLTGLDCPGCGSQRAIHALLHGDFSKAFIFNPLLIFSIPYLAVGILFEWFSFKYRYPKIRNLLFGKNAILIVASIIISFFILRNL